MAQPPANLLMLVLVGLALVAWPPPSTAEDSLPPLLSGKAPQNLDELWGGYDPIKEPLEVEVTREWEADGVICRLVRYRVGVFKGAKSIMAAIYAFPKGRGKLPGLIQVHGGGQAASPSTAIDDANRGYACISVNWGGNPLRLGDVKYDGPNTDWGALDCTHPPQRNPKNHFAGPLATDPYTLDAAESPRNSNWFIVLIGLRRAITFLEQQPEVDPQRIGVYGHSMGGNLTTGLAGIDKRIKAVTPSCDGSGDPPEAPLANVALLSSGADITASDSFGNDTPDKLIDGVTDHTLTHRWHSEIGKGHPHWLRVELARPLPVRRIVLHASAVDCFPTRIAVECRAADGQVRSLVETALVPARSVAVDLPAVTTDNLRIRILDSNAGIKGYVQLNALEVLAAITPDEARELARAAATPPGQTPPLSRGCYVTADSNGVFGRNDPNYGHPDPESSPHRLTTGAWVTQAGKWQGKRWISQMDQPHPHWVWIDMGKPRRIDRVVVRCSSLRNHPTDLRGQYSTDGGVTVKDLFTATDLVPSARKLAWEFRFKPVVTDNFRLLVEKSASSHSTNYTQLSQIEVYGKDVPTGETTVPPPAPAALWPQPRHTFCHRGCSAVSLR